MKGKKLIRLVAMLFAITMLPVNVYAAEDGNTDGLVMNKQAWLEDDGTYTIQLDAFAKGEVSTTTTKVVKPADIILVLDQSGSMVQEEIEGIPTNKFVETNGVTNKNLTEKAYYYEVGGEYFKINAKKELINKITTWVGQDGKTYTDDELSYSWPRAFDGQVYYTATPFVTASLKTYTREYKYTQAYYVNDKDSSDHTRKAFVMSAAGARETFLEKKKTDSTTVEFHNDGIPEGVSGWTAENPYYVAAVYTAVTKQEVTTYRYTYSYTDANGREVVIGQSTEGTETAVDNATCEVSPIYVKGTEPGTRLDALKYAANEFVNDIHDSAVKNNVKHRVAVVGFASNAYGDSDNQYYYANTELFKGATQYNYAVNGKQSTYNTAGNLASSQYASAYQNVLTSEGYANVQASVGELAGHGGTHPSLGFEMANGIFGANSETGSGRTKIVIFLTDGQPGDQGFDTTEADATLSQVKTSKDTYGAKVYTVAVLNENEATTQIDEFLKTTSSDGTYTLATDAEKLASFFETVDEEINNTETTVTLSENAIMLDRMSDYFVAPEGFSIEDNVTVQVAKHVGYDSFGTPTTAPATVQANLSLGNDNETVKGVYVTGFNYISEENLVTTDASGGSVRATGNKLIVTITGLLAKDEAATNTYINTNADVSGIWDTDAAGEYGLLKAFDMPHTMITKKSFVLDYAKEAELDVFNTSVNRLDSAADRLFSKVEESSTSLTETYGNTSVEAGELKYTPSTMQWSGFDTFYALGKDSERGDAKTKNIWSKVNVIPANNVYYEDDFVTNTTAGTVGIEYSGEWTETAGKGNTETPNTDVHGGWQNESLADDTAYTDGSVHETSTAGATATFTFTGRGVDIYSRTNMTSGIVRAQLFEGKDATSTASLSQVLVVDNKAASGDYYQIPTVSFMDLEQGTYTVKLTVGSKTEDGTPRSTYYLDGIRVYNPLSEDAEYSDDVMDAYGDELGAFFTEVRDILIEAETFDAGSAEADGVVFIDELDGTNGTTTSQIGTYVEYGPKNEVYLATGQAVGFYAYGLPEDKICVGIKAPEGETTAQVTNGEGTSTLNINASSDLYYEITPNKDGLIIIKNTGDNLLSITKLKMTGEMSVEPVSVMSLMSYSDEFDSLPVVAYAAEPEVDVDTPDVEGDVEIDNPEVEEDTTTDNTDHYEAIKNWVKNAFAQLKNWFGR